MDVKRVELWKERNATVLSNEAIRTVIEDHGGMVLELSNLNVAGGRVNAHPLYWFQGKGPSIEGEANASFYANSGLLYHLGGNFLCFPNFGGDNEVDGVQHPAHGWSANTRWNIVKYGSDAETGANWLLSSLNSPNSNYPFESWKLDLVVPSHPVVYTSFLVKNTGDKPLPANVAWHNTVGSPFLESGCVINMSATSFVTPIEESEFKNTGRLAFDKEFDDLSKAPLRKDGTCDLSVVPGMIGYSDFVAGRIPDSANLGWSSVINPRQKMVYLTFFPGPAVVEEDEIPFYFNNMWMQYGGRPFTPWALYEGGADHTFCLGVENSISYYANGLKEAIENETLLGAPTTVLLPPNEMRVQRYATAFTSFENSKLGNGIQSLEQSEEGLVLKQGKASALINCDSTFALLKAIEKRVLN
ncbi:MAG: hypothetical protein GX842_00020 [Spirochaetales bacterium]|jgi:hypothetical protein|nr:hypothetical protein [Spirochaetales bacterium]